MERNVLEQQELNDYLLAFTLQQQDLDGSTDQGQFVNFNQPLHYNQLYSSLDTDGNSPTIDSRQNLNQNSSNVPHDNRGSSGFSQTDSTPQVGEQPILYRRAPVVHLTCDRPLHTLDLFGEEGHIRQNPQQDRQNSQFGQGAQVGQQQDVKHNPQVGHGQQNRRNPPFRHGLQNRQNINVDQGRQNRLTRLLGHGLQNRQNVSVDQGHHNRNPQIDQGRHHNRHTNQDLNLEKARKDTNSKNIYRDLAGSTEEHSVQDSVGAAGASNSMAFRPRSSRHDFSNYLETSGEIEEESSNIVYNPEIQAATSTNYEGESEDALLNEHLQWLSVEDNEEFSKELQMLVDSGILSDAHAASIARGREQQTRLNTLSGWKKQAEKEAFRPPKFDVDGIPCNWTSQSRSTQGSGHVMQLIPLHDGQEEFDRISQELSSEGIQVTKIERLQNLYLLDRFKSEMEDMAKHRHEGFDLNIQYLFHGTTVKKSSIIEEGLDQRLSRMGFFGKGIYFSDNPVKCVCYAKTSGDKDEAYLLKCRVILGEPKYYKAGQYDSSLKREPEKEHRQPGRWRFYDSVIGCPKDYNEFVVYENRRAMIEYIISIKLDLKGTERVRTVTDNMASPPPSTDKSASAEIKCYDDDDTQHYENLRKVREAVRLKRCQDKGITYTPPTESDMQEDVVRWKRIQELHKSLGYVETTEKNPDCRIGDDMSASMSQTSGPTGQLTNQSNQTHQTGTDNTDNQDHNDGRNEDVDPVGEVIVDGRNQDVDPVGEVMSKQIQEFTTVTGLDDIDACLYYLTMANMDVNQALLLYYG